MKKDNICIWLKGLYVGNRGRATRSEFLNDINNEDWRCICGAKITFKITKDIATLCATCKEYEPYKKYIGRNSKKMKYVSENITQAIESMDNIKSSLLKRLKRNLSNDAIMITNRQLDGVRLAKEALAQILPTELSWDDCCAECGRDLKKIYEAAADVVYCCPYCGQALTQEINDCEAEDGTSEKCRI